MDIKKAFQTYYVSAIKRYFDFKGRTGRKAFWMFVLFNVILSWAAVALDNILGITQAHSMMLEHVHYGVLYNLYSLALVLPTLTIIIRRLQDVGKSWSFLFYVLIPVVGAIILLLQLIKEGDPNENEFGPVPKDDEEWQPENHPYAPSEKSEAGNSSFADATVDRQKPEDISKMPVIKEDVEQSVVKKEKSKHKIVKVDRTVKWGRDRGAKDFRAPVDKKRKK